MEIMNVMGKNEEYCCNCKYSRTNEVSENHGNNDTTFFPVHRSAFEHTFSIEKNCFEDDIKLQLCSNCKTSFYDFRVSQVKFFKLTTPTSKIALVRNIKDLPYRNTKTEVGYEYFNTGDNDGDSCLIQSETILPHTESNNVFQPTDSDGSSSSVKPIQYKEKFLKLQIEKLLITNGNYNRQHSSHDELQKNVIINESVSNSCDKCGRQFLETQLLESHRQLAHLNPLEFKYPCKFCSQRFSTLWFFKNHLEACHDGLEILHSCQLCQKKFHYKQDLEDHNVKAHDIREHPFKCVNCNESFRTIQELRVHLMKNHKESEGAKIAESNINLREASSVHKCKFCSQKFKTTITLQKHTNKVHGVPGFECRICKKLFSSQKKFIAHQITHKDCDLCKKTFIDFVRLKTHVDTVHGRDEDRPHCCEVCHQRHESSFSLSAHYNWHKMVHGPKKHFCNICNRSYTLRSHLTQHIMNMHSNKKHKCNQCTTEFKEKYRLTTHIETEHPTECLFSCKTCGKRFSTLSKVFRHSRKHTIATRTTKPENARTLIKSINSNCDETEEQIEIKSCYSSETFMFVCPICSKSSQSGSHFVRHLRLVHCIKGYADRKIKLETKSNLKCSGCGKKFERKDRLARHMRETPCRASNPAFVLDDEAQAIQNSLQCPHCSKQLNLFRDFVAHIKRHEIFIVHTDQKTKVKTEKQLIEFCNEETGSYTCFICDKKYPTQKEFMKHCSSIHIHEVKVLFQDEEESKAKFPFPCKTCPRSYPNAIQLRQHMKIHERKMKGETKCTVCNLVLATPSGLIRHMKRHHSNRNKSASVK